MEAAVVGVKTFYYLYDYDVYQEQNGLNLDIPAEFPELVFFEALQSGEGVGQGSTRRRPSNVTVTSTCSRISAIRLNLSSTPSTRRESYVFPCEDLGQEVKTVLLPFVMRILVAPNHFNIPAWRRLQLAIPRGFVPDQYVIYDFKNNSPDDYLSEFDWYRLLWINAPFDPMLNNKVVCAEILQERARVPETLFIKNKGRFVLNPRRLAHVSDAIGTVEHGLSLR